MSKEELEQQKQLQKNRKRVEKWLINNQNFINITGIEKEISAPKGLVQKFIKYDKKINDKWINPLHEVLKRIATFSLR
ncbi:hypothetical protein J8L88_12140 [Aquimarina sp. MMG015]|uniref:hypothetical protein n=1 Tax=Aquimarina TaxID=290174 RepID=UPI00041B9A43|nr:MULTISPECIES: hypothetical protein [Aquimarina]AXT56295.1 hypothetical protein D1815_11195 [Aquimarina sp. AD1]MBQ4803602.1 hypothetical protein [Aquimarina sp. MMG015]